MGALVASDTDETDPGLRDQRMRLVDHAQAGPQHRDQQRRVGQPAADGVGQRRANADLLARRVAGGLVNQHVGQVAQRGTEGRVAGAFVTQSGQPGSGQRVVDDTHIHGDKL